MTVVLSPTLVSDDYATQRAGHASLPGPTAPLVTELLQLSVPGCGTVCHYISEMLTYRIVMYYSPAIHTIEVRLALDHDPHSEILDPNPDLKT